MITFSPNERLSRYRVFMQEAIQLGQPKVAEYMIPRILEALDEIRRERYDSRESL